MKGPITYLTLLLTLAVQMGMGQNRDFASGFQINGMGQLGLPQNEFAEAFAGNPSGYALGLSLPMGKTGLLRFGGEYSKHSMGRLKSEVDVISAEGQEYVGDMTVRSDINSYHAIMRFSPSKGALRPYFDLFIGMKSYSTDAEIEVVESDGTVLTTRNRLTSEVTNSIGFAGGLQIALSTNFFLDARLQSLRGGEVQYVDSESLEIGQDGEVFYELQSTSTDMLIPQLGLSIYF